jgi:hypothetical protein
MTSFLSDSLASVTARALLAVLLMGADAHAAEPIPPPAAASPELPESVVLPSTRVREPLPEPNAVKLRIDG